MKIVALAGGVGGAKLAHGLAQVLPPEDLTVIVNTGDDFEHYGLYVCPDLDTVCYTLAGLASPETGWGRRDETWNAIENAAQLGGPAWFRLGDRDLGTHLERTRRLKAGQCLSEITRDFCHAWGIQHTVLPMTDQAVQTIVQTDQGDLEFQEYFVRRRCEPSVRGFHFAGSEQAKPAPGTRAAVDAADWIVICPSNPWVSIDPILRIINISGRPVAAVSPIIGGRTVKGPAAKMYTELGIEPSAAAVAAHYGDVLTGFVLDTIDAGLAEKMEVKTLITNTLMESPESRRRLANDLTTWMGNL